MNDLERFRDAFAGIKPYAGTPPKGFYPDWTGALTDAAFRAYIGMRPEDVGGAHTELRLPVLADGEGWFEAVSQAEAARHARGSFVMITLGACYGAQAVGSYKILQQLNPLPCKLVAVEPEPSNLVWIERHFRDNGIDPADHWILGAAIGADNDPALFPIGAPGSGAQNSMATNGRSAREVYAKALTVTGGRAKSALRSLLLENTTGLKRNLLTGAESDAQAGVLGAAVVGARQLKHRLRTAFAGGPAAAAASAAPEFFDAEIKLMSAVTLKDILGPFDRVDYLEVDIQQSEIVVFPPFMDMVRRKVRRVHIGTHGKDVHAELAALFRRGGWDIVFDYAPNAVYDTPQGKFSLNDGVLTAVNPDLA